MSRQVVRGIAWSIAVLLVVAAFLIALPGEARACDCAGPPPPEEAIAQHEWVFVGRQVGRYEVADTDRPWGGVRLQIEVLAVYKGDVPDTVELRTGRGVGDCGVDVSGYAEMGFTVSPNEDGEVGVSACGGLVRADVLRLYFEPLPGRVGSGPPGFLVGTEIGPARVAILDTAGELLTYAQGGGRLAAAAVCPGAKKVVEVVENGATDYFVGGEFPPTLEVRDLATLAIESTHIIDITERFRSQLNSMGWVFDLQCHDSDARLVTYLLPTGVRDALAGANLPGPAQLHLWRDGQLSVVAAGEARAVAVDAEAGRFYAITGIEGTTLETRDLTGREVTAVALPEGHVGWRLAQSPDRSELAVLARSAPMERENWFFAEVDRLLVIDLETGAHTSYPLPAGGFARLLEVRGSGYVVAVSQWESSTFEISQLAGGEMELIDRLPAEVGREALAVGSETIIFTPPSQDAYPRPTAWRLDLASSERAIVDGLVDSRLAITLPPGTEITNLPPLPTTTTTPETTASTVVPTTTTTASLAGATTTTQAVLLPGSEEDADGRWVQIALIAAAALLAAGGVAVVAARTIRSRRGSSSPNDGPGQAPNAEGP